jgi:hypothetical protein
MRQQRSMYGSFKWLTLLGAVAIVGGTGGALFVLNYTSSKSETKIDGGRVEGSVVGAGNTSNNPTAATTVNVGLTQKQPPPKLVAESTVLPSGTIIIKFDKETLSNLPPTVFVGIMPAGERKARYWERIDRFREVQEVAAKTTAGGTLQFVSAEEPPTKDGSAMATHESIVFAAATNNNKQ